MHTNRRMNEQPAMRTGAPVGEAVKGMARAILAEAGAAIANPALADGEAVHEFRKAMKRWRAFLRLLQPFLSDGQDLRTKARDVARELGAARDAQSALDALADIIKGKGQLGPRTLAAIRHRIEAMRQEAERSTLTEARRQAIREMLADATIAVERWPLVQLQFRDVAERLAKGYRRARRAIPKRWDQASAEDLHSLRQAVVTHRYQMELIKPVEPKLVRSLIARMQKLRDRLGAHQDLDLLSKMTASGQPLATWRGRLKPLISDRQSKHVAAAQRLAADRFAKRPKDFQRDLEALWAGAA